MIASDVFFYIIGDGNKGGIVGSRLYMSWLGCGWVECGGFSISFLGYHSSR